MYWKSFLRNQWERKGYHSYTGSDFYSQVGRRQGIKKEKKRIHTDLCQKEGMVFRSKAIDNAIEKLLDSGKYTERKMLVLKNPYCMAPLTALILFNTEFPCSVHVTLEDGELLNERTPVSTRHRIPVYGLRAGQQNQIHLEIWKEQNLYLEKEIMIETGALPKSLQGQVQVREKKKASASPFTMAFGGDTKYPYAFDEHGEVRYYIRQTIKSYGIYQLSGGRFLYLSPNVEIPSFSNPHSALAMEMDFMGRVYREYLIPDGIHHDGCEMKPGGNILSLSSSMDEHVEDTVIEIDRNTGKVVKRLYLRDVLSEHPYFDLLDWAHLNTVSYQPEEGTILLCARNLHSVFKIDWQTEKLIWILCDTSFWENTPYADRVLSPKGEISFCYQPHAAYFLSEQTGDNKTLIIYDNHWNKRRPVESFDGDEKSYVRIYEINEKENTVQLQSSYQTTKSKIRSNGIVMGDHVFAMSGALVDSIEGCQGRITEFDRESGEVLNDYLTKTNFYRAYPFFADFTALCQPMEEKAQILGDKEGVENHTGVEAETIPEKEGMPEIGFEFYEDILLVSGTDHQVQKIFFCGKHHRYLKDYSHTVQKNPACFGNMKYSMPVPTAGLLPDHYQIYIQSNGLLYDTKKTFQIAG